MPHKPDQGSGSGHVSQNAPESKSASANIWGALERMPGFNERIERGKAQLAKRDRVEFEPKKKK